MPAHVAGVVSDSLRDRSCRYRDTGGKRGQGAAGVKGVGLFMTYSISVS